MKKVLLLGHLGFRNFGDELMLDAFVNYYGNACPLVHWTVCAASIDDKSLSYPHEQIKQSAISILRSVWKNDAVVIVGGTTFHDYYSNGRIVRHWWVLAKYVGILWYARLLKKKVFLLGVGIGPFRSAVTRSLCRLWLGSAHSVAFRDSASLGFARKICGEQIKFRKGADLAYLSRVTPIKATGHRIVVNLIDASESTKEVSCWIRQTYDLLTNDLIKLLNENERCEVEFLPLGMGSRDRDDSELRRMYGELLVKFGERVTLQQFDPNPEEVLKRLQQCRFLITCRFHGAIAGVLLDLPTIAVAYHPKVAGLLSETEIPSLRVVEFPHALSPRMVSEGFLQAIESPTQNADHIHKMWDSAAFSLQDFESWVRG